MPAAQKRTLGEKADPLVVGAHRILQGFGSALAVGMHIADFPVTHRREMAVHHAAPNTPLTCRSAPHGLLTDE